jgi:hypothetical protein
MPKQGTTEKGFVELESSGGGGAVSSVNSKTGAVVLDTSDINDTTNKRYVTDAQQTVIGNTSGTNTGDETTSSIQTKRPLKTVNGNSLEGSGNIIISSDRQIFRNTLTTAFATTSTTLSLVTGWTVSLEANKIYRISLISNYQTSANTTGFKIGLGGTAVGNLVGQHFYAGPGTTVGVISSLAYRITTTSVGSANNAFFNNMEIIFRVTTSGTFFINFATEVNNSSAQLNIGSTLTINDIT